MKRQVMRFLAVAVLGLGLLSESVAQDFFGARPAGWQENPPRETDGTGVIVGQLAEESGSTFFVLQGFFRNLVADYTASHIHIGFVGENGDVVWPLTSELDADQRGGRYHAAQNTFGPLTADQIQRFRDGGYYVNIHSTLYPPGEIRGQIVPVPPVNGDLSDPLYTEIATKQHEDMPWGPIDARSIRFHADDLNRVLFLGVVGQLNTGSSDGIGLWLNITGEGSSEGVPAGTSLGVSGAGHYMDGDGGTQMDFRADFEVDYMFAVNPGGGATTVFFDAVSHVDGGVPQFIGAAPQDGTPVVSPSSAGVFDDSTFVWAFDNSAGEHTGWEIAISYEQLGIAPPNGGNGNGNEVLSVFSTEGPLQLEAFAFVVSSTGWFSRITVPGLVGEDPGFNADFSTLEGGPFHSDAGDAPLPVELAYFHASLQDDDVVLIWETVSETDNVGFDVQRAARGGEFASIGFVNGRGSAVQGARYEYRSDGLDAGTYQFRLRQIDRNGSASYSPVIEVEVGVPGRYVLERAYPNPFNPQTAFRFGVAMEQHVSVRLFDMMGRSVREVFAGTVPANEMQHVTIDGAGLASGVYMVRVVGDAFSAAQTITLLK